MARHVDFLLIGGGAASATAADTLRSEGAEGSIAILAAEGELPYFRPPLSKQFLLGIQTREQLNILEQADYRRLGIEFLPATRALALDPGAQLVQTNAVGALHYGKLLIATGSSPRRLDVPGGALPGSCCLRTVADSEAIKKAGQQGGRAVVVGANFLGMELASSLTLMGMKVTLLCRGAALFDMLQAPVISGFFLDYYRERGVEVIFGEEVRELQGERRVERVVTSAGRILPCGLVAIGIGAEPQTDFLEGSGIALEDGVLVDRYLQTDDPHIFAAGDVANFFDPVFAMRRRIEHWDNAVKQGRLAAKNMLGQHQSYSEVSYFFSDIFDLNFEFLGCVEGADQLVCRGSLAEKSFALFYLRNKVPRALFSLGRPELEIKATESLISHRVNLEPFLPRLPDQDFPLETIPAETVLILQGGGALGAFECGVVNALEEADIHANIVAGVSIGAFNAAIIAGNPKHASAALESFWADLALETAEVPDDGLRQLLACWQILLFGSPSFFRPRWLMPIRSFADLPFNWTSYYDPSPVKDLLRRYVDFGRLKDSPVRLLVSAVNVATAELETFDSYVDDLTPDHILASGSLPPGFPWTTVNRNNYWDGGIVSNSPLNQVVERCGGTNKRVFIIDLYPSSKRLLPENLMSVTARRDEIVYSEKIHKDVRTRELVHDYRGLINEILKSVDPLAAGHIKQRPRYIQLMNDLAPMAITRIIYEGEGGELPSKDYDFSRKSIEGHKKAGRQMARRTLQQMRSPGDSMADAVQP